MIQLQRDAIITNVTKYSEGCSLCTLDIPPVVTLTCYDVCVSLPPPVSAQQVTWETEERCQKLQQVTISSKWDYFFYRHSRKDCAWSSYPDFQTQYSQFLPNRGNCKFCEGCFLVARCEVCSPYYLVLLSKQAMETHVQGVKCEDVSMWWRFPPEIFVSNGWLFTKYPSLNISINLHEFDTQKPTIPARLPASPRK